MASIIAITIGRTVMMIVRVVFLSFPVKKNVVIARHIIDELELIIKENYTLSS